jgi:hypothetical protein
MITPIETGLGKLHGRDAIYLDSENFNKGNRSLTLTGELNGDLCINDSVKGFVAYSVIFNNVSSYEKTELDDWLKLDKPNFNESSSFYQIVNDNGLVTFVIQTYDWVFEIICDTFVFNVGCKRK